MHLLARFIGVPWAIIGVSALLLRAIIGLSKHAKNAIESGLTTWQWSVLVLFALFMVVAEGYRGFQKKFSPRTAARVKYLRDHPTLLRIILAPIFSMGFFHANRKTKLTAYILTTGIICLVVAITFFCPDPWRGIIDFGVVLGLTWGLISFWIFAIQALTKTSFSQSPETPNS
ncbi:MAG: hypothetical protein P8P36_03400 [Akkermansiaceae bacterium]|nr:hypothetical protein [Akkermansiaceae bacterium]